MSDTNGTVNHPSGADSETDTTSGHIIIRLNRKLTHDSPDLRELAAHHEFQALHAFLTNNAHLRAERVIRHVSPDIIREREHIAAQTAFKPLETLTAYWRIDVRSETAPEAHRAALHAMPEVAIAYHETAVRDASDDVLAGNMNVYEKNQGFLNASPEGIGAHGAWRHADSDGNGVNVIDLESGWILAHEDLPEPRLFYGDNKTDFGDSTGDHGAAAMGIVSGVNNEIGIIGVAPKVASLNAVSHYDGEKKTGLHVADAVDAAAKHLDPGDILLLEVQRCEDRKVLPVEIESADLHAIRHAVAQGIIVIEAAGNGKQGLDAWADPSGQHSLNRGAKDFVDSGAIVVGSCYAMVVPGADGCEGHQRYYSSNYGTRVDTYAWGEKIFTSGFGNLEGSKGSTNSYTSNFGQTSGASAILAGAAAVVQSWHKRTFGVVLTAEEMREILTNPDTSTPQVNANKDGAIGVMPDLEMIITSHLAAGQALNRVRHASGATVDLFGKFKARKP